MLSSFIEIYFKFSLGVGIVFNQLFFSIIMVLLLHKKEEWWKVVVEILASFVFTVLFLTILYTFIELPYAGSFITYMGFPLLVTLCTYLLSNIFLKKEPWKNQIITGCSYYSLFYPIALFSGWLGTCQDYQWHLDTKFDFTLFSTLFLLALSTFFMIRFDSNKFEENPRHSFWMSVGYFVFCLTLCQIVRIIVSPLAKPNRAILIPLYSIIIIMSLYVYWSLYNNAKEYEEKISAEIFFENHKNDETFMRMAQENYDSLRKLRHDIKNQYSAMDMLLKSGQYDELQKFFDEYVERYRSVLHYVNCGNKVVDNLLNLERSKAENYGISIKSKIAIPPILPFTNSELCSLITNVMDNAIEYLSSMSIENKTISMTMEMQGSYYIMTVKNPIKTGEKINLKSRKKDNKNHGYGLRIVEKLANDKRGSMVIDTSNDVFCITVMLEAEMEQNYGYQG